MVSHNSRAARRGEEPPSKDLLVSKAPKEEIDYKPWLHTPQSAGVGKKKKTKQLTRQQRARQQKLFEKADVNVNKLERKVADSKARAKRVQARAKDWEELNNELEGEKEPKDVKEVEAVVDEPTTTGEPPEETVMADIHVPVTEKADDGVAEDPVAGADGTTIATMTMTTTTEPEVDEVT